MTAVVRVQILGDDASLEAALNRGEVHLSEFAKTAKTVGDNLQSVGRTITHGITVPVAAAAAGATKMAYDYQTALQKTINLSGGFGISQQQLSNQIMAVSKATGQSATDLANALYPVQSSLHNTQASFGVLNEAAKMSSVGMGDVATTADALTSVINVYGTQNMSAAKAADIFTATVQSSKFQIADLATALPRVLNTAKNAGIGFQALGGDLAALSHSGMSADQAVTGMQAAISNMIQATRGTGNAAKELASLGLSAKGLIQDMQTHGAVSALDEIVNKVKASGTAAHYTQAQWQDFANQMGMSVDEVKKKFQGLDLGALQKIFPNRKALGTILGLTDTTDKAAQDAAKEVATNFTGSLDKAFQNWSKSGVGGIKIALNDLKLALIAIGNDILPKVEHAIQDVANWWDHLSPKTQDAAKKFALVAAETGPLLLVFGKVVSGIGAVSKAFEKAPWALAITGFALLYANSKTFRDMVGDCLKPVQDLFGFVENHKTTFAIVGAAIGGAATALGALKLAEMAQTVWATASAGATGMLAGAFWALDAAMDINPFVLAAAAVAAVGVALYEAWQHSQTFRQIVVDIVNVLTGAFMDAVKAASNMVLSFGLAFLYTVKGMISVGNTILGWFGMSLPDGVKNGVNDSINYLNSLQDAVNQLHGTNIQIGVSVVQGTVNTGPSTVSGAQLDRKAIAAGGLPTFDASQYPSGYFTQTQDAQNAATEQQAIDALTKQLSGLTGGAGGGGGVGAAAKKGAAAGKAAATAVKKAAALAAAEALANTNGIPLLNIGQWLMSGLINTGKDGPVTTAAKKLADDIKKNFTVKGGTVPQAAQDAMTALNNLAQQASSFNTGFQSKLAAGADIASFFKGTGAGAGDYKAYLQQQVNELKTYGQDLQALAKKGLPPTMLQQLAAVGLDGYDVVQGLMNASPSDLGQIIGLGAQITGLSQSIANQTEASVFKPGAMSASVANGQISSHTAKDKKGHTITVNVNNADAAKIAKTIAQTLQNAS